MRIIMMTGARPYKPESMPPLFSPFEALTVAHSAMSSTDSILDKLYTLPLLKGTFSLSGSTDESAKKLLEKLRDNYVKWHPHFDSRGFHKYRSLSIFPC